MRESSINDGKLSRWNIYKGINRRREQNGMVEETLGEDMGDWNRIRHRFHASRLDGCQRHVDGFLR